jgi:transposase InsO family protein
VLVTCRLTVEGVRGVNRRLMGGRVLLTLHCRISEWCHVFHARWQRKHNNRLWQCDLKVVRPARWLITNLDDRSRFVTGSEHFNEGTTENLIWPLDRAIHEYSKPREILTDHGSQFWSVRRDESSFTAHVNSRGSSISSAASASQQRSQRSKDGSESTTSNMPDSSSAGNSSNTTITSDHT